MFIRIDEGEEGIDCLNIEDKDIDTIKNSDIVIVSDYNKGFLSEHSLEKIGFFSKYSVIDTKRYIKPSLYSTYSFIKLNEHEYKTNVDNIKNYWLEKIIVTLGPEGAKCGGVQYKSPNPQETIDVSGAGDTFTAAFSLKYYYTKNIPQSITYANKMSSIVVSKRGVSTP